MISTHLAGRVPSVDTTFVIHALAAVIDFAGAASSIAIRTRSGVATFGFVHAVALLGKSAQEKRQGAIPVRHANISRIW